MPYITQEAREELKTRSPKTAGELNYAITLIIKDYGTKTVDMTKVNALVTNYWNESAKNYQAINDVIGALLGATMEFERRNRGYTYSELVDQLGNILQSFYDVIAGPYEDEKIKVNGDVYP